MVFISAAAKEPPHHKKKKVETSRSCPLSSFPEELALNCLARVPRSDYGALSLVSKRYRSLLVSHDLYNMRSLMGLMEKCHYVCITRIHSIPCWYILRRENTKFRLIPIPSLPSQASQYSSVVVLDWGIYLIGGWGPRKSKSSDVLLFDCRTHTWRKLPSMAVARSKAAAGVVDGKIYVFGGCKNINSSKWGEVFDPKTQTWDTLVPLPDRNTRLEGFDASMVTGEKLYAVENNYQNNYQSRMVYFSPSEGKWGRNNFDSKPYLNQLHVMVDTLLYEYFGGKFYWCEKEEFKWKEVKGLDSLLMTLRKFLTIVCKLINFGENILVIWRAAEPSVVGTSSDIWCAEISLERRGEGDEIWGKVEWLGSLITLDHPPSNFSKVSYSVSVNL